MINNHAKPALPDERSLSCQYHKLAACGTQLRYSDPGSVCGNSEYDPYYTPDARYCIVAQDQAQKERNRPSIGPHSAILQDSEFQSPTDEHSEPGIDHPLTGCQDVSGWMKGPPQEPGFHGHQEHGEEEAEPVDDH